MQHALSDGSASWQFRLWNAEKKKEREIFHELKQAMNYVFNCSYTQIHTHALAVAVAD